MLKLIEEDADSFAKRAEMYYKKRPELISLVQDFYRAHRSLAERYDQIKSESSARLLTTLGSPFSGEKSRQEKPVPTPIVDKNYDSYSESFDHDENAESEVEDPDEDNGSDGPEVETPRALPKREQARIGRLASPGRTIKEDDGEELRKLRDEIERLSKENRAQREQLEQKDEEKREVIRQLSFAVGMLKEENASLRKSVNKVTKKRGNFEVNNNNKVKGGFLSKLFHGSFLNSQETLVAL
ncbi:protein NETWORKED 3A-like isoform X2 [Punica granatum]|nr:protein NETWORKED 3A-like isoform X2 [Punica granatum]OWM87199.1 hypothetical protein CDL15_Pgr010231 [Punica granatum]